MIKTIIGLNSTSGKAEFMGFDITGDLSERNESLIQSCLNGLPESRSTMNPSYTVGRQIGRPMIRWHRAAPASTRRGDQTIGGDALE
ncbi:MAG: hypothetical protein R2867_46360 [Caldilineaceae bacterium]